MAISVAIVSINEVSAEPRAESGVNYCSGTYNKVPAHIIPAGPRWIFENGRWRKVEMPERSVPELRQCICRIRGTRFTFPDGYPSRGRYLPYDETTTVDGVAENADCNAVCGCTVVAH